MPDPVSSQGRKWMLRVFIIFVGIMLFTGRFIIVLHRQDRYGSKHDSNLQLEFPTSNFTVDRVVESNLNYNCSFEGRPVCCDVVASDDPIIRPSSSMSCSTERKYFPSGYESRHIGQAGKIAENSSEHQRLDDYFDFVYSDDELVHSMRWLERVRLRNLFDHSIEVSEEDTEYLSKYEVTRTCISNDDRSQQRWVEWIEPLSIHLRHPFSGATCPVVNKYGLNIHDLLTNHNIPFSDLQSTDYILVQPNKVTSEKNTSDLIDIIDGSRTFLMDVGSSYFDSSLFGLLCMYYKHSIAFQELYGWEMVPLDAQLYWKSVPAKYKAKLHYYNIPAMTNSTDAGSPLHTIGSITTLNDFIALKVDVNDLNVEVPLLLHVLENHKVSHLIDELFVNIRYRCEVMLHCGWPESIPAEKAGIVLDRVNILKLFQRLRHMGIRAHVWP